MDLESDKISLINKLRGFEDSAAATAMANLKTGDDDDEDKIDVLKDQIEALKGENDQLKKLKKEQDLDLKKTNQALDKAEEDLKEMKKKMKNMESSGEGAQAVGASGGDTDAMRRLEERIMDLEAQLGSSAR